MKRIVAILLCLVAAFVGLPAGKAEIAPSTSGDYGYVLEDGGAAVITWYTGSASKLDVPAELDGHAVTSIGKKAFNLCFSLKSVTIPEGVTRIGDYAFCNCSDLNTISIPASVSSISESAFFGCGLAKIQVSEKNPVYHLIDGVLIDIKQKRLHTYPPGKAASTYTIPESVTSIGDFAISSCRCLKNITIPSNVISISARAFAGNYFQSFKVAENHPVYNVIGGVLFDKTQKLLHTYPCEKPGDTYTIPEGMTAIGPYAFTSSYSLTKVIIPNGVTSIGDHAFFGHISIQTAVIPESMVSIGEGAFDGCSDLNYLYIPTGLVSIGEGAFSGCGFTGLRIDVAAENPVYQLFDGVLFDKKQKLLHLYPRSRPGTSYTVPDGTLAIGAGAFSGCDNLRSIIIPNGVTSIGDEAFSLCSNLNQITIPASVTSIGEDVFSFFSYTGNRSITMKFEPGSYAQQYALTHGWTPLP